MAATLAAAQKLASSEDAAPAEEDEDENEVWLRAQVSGVGGGRQQMRGKPRPCCCPY